LVGVAPLEVVEKIWDWRGIRTIDEVVQNSELDISLK
jgi:hypothetical protein